MKEVSVIQRIAGAEFRKEFLHGGEAIGAENGINFKKEG